MRALSQSLLILLAGRVVTGQQVISFNRTAGEIEVGTCEGLKKNAELGIDISVVVTANLRCAETITVPTGVHVSIGSAADENYLIAIAENFASPDPSSITLLVNPEGSHLSLDDLTFANEAGTAGSPGVARAVWNQGSLEVNGCSFVGLNYASLQDGGAIYSTAEPGGNSGGAFLSVKNSTFEGNIAENHGGAIASWGEGEVELSNCSFVGNEAVGTGDYRRAGTGGAVYASAGVFVTVLNSSFEGCLGRYGGAALFACGADIYESTFDGNEATGLFGAVVNGDLSDEERADATLSYGGPAAGENYTCPPLLVSGTIFDGNVAVTGHGGAIASVDSSLSVFNSSMLDTFGGAVYFGTSADDGRDQLEMELVQFNVNEGSSSSPDFVGSAFLVERTGTPVSNTTGPLETIELPGSSASSSSGAAAVAQSVGPSAPIGVARDIYCFQNSPYDCEAYFGGVGGGDDAEIAVQLAGAFRCNACKGAAFTGIGSADGAPLPTPADVDDDDGLSEKGQERAQGGTPSPAGPGTGAEDGDAGPGTGPGEALSDESEPELLGATGGMRWVVVGLIVGIGGALLVCMCLLTVCRTKKGRKRTTTRAALDPPAGGGKGGGEEEEKEEEEGRLGGAAMVGPRSTSASVAGDTHERGFGSAGGARGGVAMQDVFCASSPRTSAAADVDAETSRPAITTTTTSRRPAGGGDRSRSSSSRRLDGGDLSRSSSLARRPNGADLSRSSSRRPSATTDSSRPNSRRPSVRAEGGGGRDPRRDTNDSAVAVVNELTPQASERKAREVARQRSVEMINASEDGWASPPLVSAWGQGVPVGGAGHVAVSSKSTPTKQGFTALPDERTSSRSGGREDGAAARELEPWVAVASSADAAAEAAAQVTAVPRGRQEERGRERGRGAGAGARRSSPRETTMEPVVVERQSSRSSERELQQQQQYRAAASRSRAKIKPPSGATYGTPSRERTTDRAPARAVRTPAGGARLSISAATTSTPSSTAGGVPAKGRGRGRVNASGKSVAAATAAAVAGAATELEASGQTQFRPDATVVSSEENPVYSHDRSDDGARKRSNSRSRFRIMSQSPVRRSNSSRRGDSRERGGGGAAAGTRGGGGGGWASELYRMSPGPKKDRSAKVYSGKFDASRSDWSADGEVEWNRHSPAVTDGREKRFK